MKYVSQHSRHRDRDSKEYLSNIIFNSVPTWLVVPHQPGYRTVPKVACALRINIDKLNWINILLRTNCSFVSSFCTMSICHVLLKYFSGKKIKVYLFSRPNPLRRKCELDVFLQIFLIPILNGGERVVSNSGCFTPANSALCLFHRREGEH
jgi:hypothetical protein